MKYISMLVIGFAVTLSACNSEPVEKITGAYARENTVEIKNPETMQVKGKAIFRDTIFITVVKDGYQLSNRVWRENDYDTVGWKEQTPGNGNALRTYTATYNSKDQSLRSVITDAYKPLILDFRYGFLYFDTNRHKIWNKVRE